MAGSTFGTIFRVSTWGESHGKGVGVVVDGCPAGLSITEEDIQVYLNRRKPGQSRFTTPRKEDDCVEILSGVFEGKTTGTPISMVVYNKTQRSGIIPKSQAITGRGMRIILLIRNMASGITAVADVPQEGKPLQG